MLHTLPAVYLMTVVVPAAAPRHQHCPGDRPSIHKHHLILAVPAEIV